MGHFSTACMISGLPIGYGEPVRFVAMSENPFRTTKHFTCYIHDQWVPLHVPIKAKYNDYGSIEDIEDSENSRSFFRVLSYLSVERPDEGPHESKVEKGMSDEDWLKALWHQRVRVTRPMYMFTRRRSRLLEINADIREVIGEQYSVYNLKQVYENVANLPVFQVTWAMVREDVWQAMLAISPETPEQRALGLATPVLHPEDGFTVDSEIEGAIEYKRIQDAMHNLSRIWTPGHTSGPQCPEYKDQAVFTAAVAAIAQARRQQEIDEYETDY